jgi:hypothetical protein
VEEGGHSDDNYTIVWLVLHMLCAVIMYWLLLMKQAYHMADSTVLLAVHFMWSIQNLH